MDLSADDGVRAINTRIQDLLTQLSPHLLVYEDTASLGRIVAAAREQFEEAVENDLLPNSSTIYEVESWLVACSASAAM